MRAISATAPRTARLPVVVVAGLLGLLATAVVVKPAVAVVPALAILFFPLVLAQRWLLVWRRLIAATILVVLFIPIKRYGLPGHLPFDLEPYRVAVALLIGGWFGCLLIDPRVRFRKTAIDAPILLIALATVLSDATNQARIRTLAVQSEATKGLMFLASFFLICYLIVSVVRTRRDVERLLEVTILGAAVVGIFALIEYRTKFNAFEHLRTVMPFLRSTDAGGPGITRGGRQRVFASAQHPVALGALFAMLVPLAFYLAMRPGRRRWWLPAAAVSLGAIASVSRTSMLMLAVVGLSFLVQRPRKTLKAWPLIVPALVIVQLALPGAVRSVASAFFPKGGLIAEQNSHANWGGRNRLSHLGPTLSEWSQRPIVGEGFSTRQPLKHPETPILDDQWLKTLVETGFVGALGWLWLFTRSIRRLARQSRHAPDGGWLEVSLASAVAAFAVGMAFYDAFSFIQVTVMLFVVLGLGAALANPKRARVAAKSPLSAPSG